MASITIANDRPQLAHDRSGMGGDVGTFSLCASKVVFEKPLDLLFHLVCLDIFRLRLVENQKIEKNIEPPVV